MATDLAADVRKYAPNADDKAIAGIVRYCGIALQKRDSAQVSFGDKEEVARVRSNFLKKKLGLTLASVREERGRIYRIEGAKQTAERSARDTR